jgi:hypothetical protein
MRNAGIESDGVSSVNVATEEPDAENKVGYNNNRQQQQPPTTTTATNTTNNNNNRQQQQQQQQRQKGTTKRTVQPSKGHLSHHLLQMPKEGPLRKQMPTRKRFQTGQRPGKQTRKRSYYVTGRRRQR